MKSTNFLVILLELTNTKIFKTTAGILYPITAIRIEDGNIFSVLCDTMKKIIDMMHEMNMTNQGVINLYRPFTADCCINSARFSIYFGRLFFDTYWIFLFKFSMLALFNPCSILFLKLVSLKYKIDIYTILYMSISATISSTATQSLDNCIISFKLSRCNGFVYLSQYFLTAFTNFHKLMFIAVSCFFKL